MDIMEKAMAPWYRPRNRENHLTTYGVQSVAQSFTFPSNQIELLKSMLAEHDLTRSTMARLFFFQWMFMNGCSEVLGEQLKTAEAKQILGDAKLFDFIPHETFKHRARGPINLFRLGDILTVKNNLGRFMDPSDIATCLRVKYHYFKDRIKPKMKPVCHGSFLSSDVIATIRQGHDLWHLLKGFADQGGARVVPDQWVSDGLFSWSPDDHCWRLTPWGRTRALHKWPSMIIEWPTTKVLNIEPWPKRLPWPRECSTLFPADWSSLEPRPFLFV